MMSLMFAELRSRLCRLCEGFEDIHANGQLLLLQLLSRVCRKRFSLSLEANQILAFFTFAFTMKLNDVVHFATGWQTRCKDTLHLEIRMSQQWDTCGNLTRLLVFRPWLLKLNIKVLALNRGSLCRPRTLRFVVRCDRALIIWL